jgi:hypothetical protein
MHENMNASLWNHSSSVLHLGWHLAPLSFSADYLLMDQDSVFHVMDRSLAVPLVMTEIWRIASVWRHARHRCLPVVATAMFVAAVYSFMCSQQAQSEYDVGNFITWHNRWHL